MRYEQFKPLPKKLVESVGFPNRKHGDEFYNPKDDNDKSTFVELILWPDKQIAYENPQQRDEALQYFQDNVEGKVYLVNKPNNGMLGLYIVHMISGNQDEYYVRYVKNVGNVSGLMTDIPAGVKASGHGGYKYGSASAKKEAYAIKPSNVFNSEGPYDTTQIASAIQSKQDIPEDLKSQMVGYLSALASGNKEYVMKGGDGYRSVHENYTGEFAAPIAVITDAINNNDVRQRAENALLGGESFANCKIIFPLSATEKLVDSKLVAPNGRIVGISSKASKGGGAAASLAGLHDTIVMKSSDADFQPLLKEFAPEIDMIETVVLNSAEQGFLILAEKHGLINDQDVAVFKQGFADSKRGKKTNVNDLTPALREVISKYGADTDNPRYNPIYHASAGVSRRLGSKLGEMNITECVKALLNFSTMCQIYAGTRKSGPDIQMDSFKMIWPPQYEGSVVIDTAKNFTGTEIRGKISFKFK